MKGKQLKAEVRIVGNEELSQAASRVLQRSFEMEREPVTNSGNIKDGLTSSSGVCINLWLTEVKSPSWKGEDRPFSEKDKAKRKLLLDRILKKHNWILSEYFIKRSYPGHALEELLEIIGEYLDGIPYEVANPNF